MIYPCSSPNIGVPAPPIGANAWVFAAGRYYISTSIHDLKDTNFTGEAPEIFIDA